MWQVPGIVEELDENAPLATTTGAPAQRYPDVMAHVERAMRS